MIVSLWVKGHGLDMRTTAEEINAFLAAWTHLVRRRKHRLKWRIVAPAGPIAERLRLFCWEPKRTHWKASNDEGQIGWYRGIPIVSGASEVPHVMLEEL